MEKRSKMLLFSYSRPPKNVAPSYTLRCPILWPSLPHLTRSAARCCGLRCPMLRRQHRAPDAVRDKIT